MKYTFWAFAIVTWLIGMRFTWLLCDAFITIYGWQEFMMWSIGLTFLTLFLSFLIFKGANE